MRADWQEHRDRLDAYVTQGFDYPADRFEGRGIVMCMGGRRYFTNGYVAIRRLRDAGCTLPISIFHHGNNNELTSEMRSIITPLVDTVNDLAELRKKYPARRLNGWESKPYAIIHSKYREVLLLDADNVVTCDPSYLFESPQFKKTGAIFWPDFGRLEEKRLIWGIMGVEYRNEPEFETGQVVVDKAKCWTALNVTMFLNEWSDFYYEHIHGDKETFHMAWRKLHQDYSMPERGIDAITGVMCQHDFDGNRLFQHRNMRKWTLDGDNPRDKRFLFEEECIGYLGELRKTWDESIIASMPEAFRQLSNEIVTKRKYLYVRVGFDQRTMEFNSDGKIGVGRAGLEQRWAVTSRGLEIEGDAGVICQLQPDNGIFRGQWLHHEKMPVILIPV